MIQKLQKIFHTDKWWGKVLLILLLYILYWFIFYGIWLLISKNWGEAEFDIYRLPISIFYFASYVILPVLSFFFFPKLLRKIIFLKHPYLINSIFIFLTLIISLFFELLIASKHFLNFV